MSVVRYINNSDKAVGTVPAWDQSIHTETVPALDKLLSATFRCIVDGNDTQVKPAEVVYAEYIPETLPSQEVFKEAVTLEAVKEPVAPSKD